MARDWINGPFRAEDFYYSEGTGAFSGFINATARDVANKANAIIQEELKKAPTVSRWDGPMEDDSWYQDDEGGYNCPASRTARLVGIEEIK